MTTHKALMGLVLAATGAVVATAVPASATVIERGHFTETVDSGVYDCDGLFTGVDTGTVDINYRAVQRASSRFPRYSETTHGTVTTTNLDTGGTFTQHFSGSSRDHRITDNGDGTITILVHSQGGFRGYDQFGNFVLNDPGGIWFSFVVDYNGTPGDPSDDIEVPDSFQIVRESTGRNDLEGREFCSSVLEFTS